MNPSTKLGTKRVLIFSLTYYPDLIGGAEISVRKIVDDIDPSQITFDMVTLQFDSTLPKEERVGNVDVHRIGFAKPNPRISELSKSPLKWNKYLYPFIAFSKARKLHAKTPYDAIWSPMTSYATFGALFFKLWYPKIRYLATLNDGDPIEYLKRRALLVYPLFVRLFTKADLIHVTSNYLAHFARSMGYRGALELVPNALSVEQFAREYPQAEIEAIKVKHNKKSNDIFLITTSRLVKKNAVNDIIRALALLPENISLLVLGKGYLLESLQHLARMRGVENRVHFLGHVDSALIPKYLKACDIFIRPSLSEGMGSSIVEAMAAGIPVIATQEGGLADSIIDPDRNPTQKPTALAVNARDAEGIAKQVTRLLDNKTERDQIVANAKEFATTRYSTLRTHDAMLRVFDKLFSK
jgi:glycosyltransferase involved in cell wall biosynthesis